MLQRNPRNRQPLFGTAFILIMVVGASFGTAIAGVTSRRMVFLGPRAPCLIEVSISAGKYSVKETRQQYAQVLFQVLDTNGDGNLSPEEAAAVPVSGRLRAGAPTLGSKWSALDTAPADETLSPAELATYLESVSGRDVLIRLEPPKLSQTVRLYEDLDLDQDGKISDGEVERGFTVLRSFDFDDDESLSVAELQPFPRSMIEAQRQERTRQAPVPLLMLSTSQEKIEAVKRCLAQYGEKSVIPERRMPGIESRRFARFDNNHDRQWDGEELSAFIESAPVDLELVVSLDANSIVPAGERIQRGQRPLLNLGGVPVEFRAINRREELADSTKLYKIRFRTSDTDKNGYLDEREFAGLQASGTAFQAVDLNGNNQVSLEEIERFFSLDGLARQSQLVISLSNETKTLFDILDTHGMLVGAKELGDKRLTPREFAEGRRRLLAFDRDHDSALVQTELANEFRLTFSQAELLDETPIQGMMPNNSPRTVVAENQSGPIWYRRMDTNGDGDVTWREFLGPRDDFEKLDTNHDGFIDAGEAESGESLRKID